MFGSWLRRVAYWALDGIKGGKVKHHINDIAQKMAGGY